jgi:antitoxin (DNA-binding transcriptional repressor) of toxin-antitoxin stability system
MTPKSLITNRESIRKIGSLLLLLVLVFGPGSAFSALASQEVTGNIEGTLKDPSGAVIPNATVTAANAQRTFTATTNDEGMYRFNNLQPGLYTITATNTGFGSVKRDDVTVELGRTLQVNFEMKPVGAGETVTVTASDEPIVDVTSTKTATNITQQEIDVLPKTRNFSSLINVAPGTREESKAGGFQIDGASGSENRFVVDGLDVTRVFGGQLGSSKNIPYDFVKEVQVKSAGYEAEFGGATGGVVNVVTRGGTNEWHGEGKIEYTSDRFRAEDNPTLRLKPTNPLNQAEYFFNPKGKDETRQVDPVFSIGGPILKDKLWFFGSYAPSFYRRQRNLDLRLR